jgi:hypothetical protein
VTILTPGEDGIHIEDGDTFFLNACYVNNPGNIAYYVDTMYTHFIHCSSDGGLYSFSLADTGNRLTDCHSEGATTAGILLAGGNGHGIVNCLIIVTPICIIDSAAQNIECNIIGNRLYATAGAGSVGIKLHQAISYEYSIIGNIIRGAEIGIDFAAYGGLIAVGNLIYAGAGSTIGINVNPVDANTYNSVIGNVVEGFTTSIKHQTGNKTFYSGNEIDIPLSQVSGHARIQSNQLPLSFTCAAAASTTVNNANVTAYSLITLIPVNTAAATLMGSAKALYQSATVNGVSFTMTTANGAAAVGTEEFAYMIFD